MPRLRDMTPLAPVTDVRAAARWFERVLGFEATLVTDTVAYLARDGAAIRLLRAKGDMTEEARQQGYYIDVEDVDGLYAELRERIEPLPETQPPADTGHGMREFVVVYEALMLVFGEPIREGA